jgi:acyl transferase domain-containing protein/NAD(P)H-dependent flavin oxidoreductase YrpB (nitropropane dioxygenase family)/NAD(P)-dependent dehydrogenase (short-subunit alcohol dehydrogenase family)
MSNLRLVVLTPPGLIDPSLAIAGSRAGGLGVLDLEYGAQTPAARQAWTKLCHYGGNDIGLRLSSQDLEFLQEITPFPDNLRVVILTHPEIAPLEKGIDQLHPLNIQVFLECTSLEEAQLAEKAGADGVIAKGNEAGGRIGNETTFILLQRCLQNLRIPIIWVQGGIGLHTAAACHAAGAQGVILDSQILLTRESPLPEAAKARVRSLDGTETVVLGEDLGECYRVCGPLGLPVIKDLQTTEKALVLKAPPGREAVLAWRRAVAQRVGWSSTPEQLLLGGQDLGFASALARQFETVAGILAGINQAIADHCRAAVTCKPLAAESSLAQSHGTRYPIVQGPMARVSDTPVFASLVAQGGALPFVAAAWMRAPQLEALLRETKVLLGDRAWGVGLLGFLPTEVLWEQLNVVLVQRPPFALIAGGQPEQVKLLEGQGINTYLHVPSPELLRMFFKAGVTRFVFEGRESGGHVGPLGSFVLNDTMIGLLLELLTDSQAFRDYHVLFAGGIHDALSASMVAAMAAPLAEKGVRLGVQLGTAYLFTKEAVASGAIVPAYQQEAIRCDGTTLLVSGPGNAERCINTPFAATFKREKWRQAKSGVPAEEIRHLLERLKLGRLRIATKGIARNPEHEADPKAPRFLQLSEPEQLEQGMYMVGQLAALRRQAVTIESLHEDISAGGTGRLEKLGPAPGEIPESREADRPADVAIIGMACLLPRAADLKTFWQNILNKVGAIEEVPPERWDWRLYYDQDQRARDKVCSKHGAFLGEIPFDPIKYGMPPNSLQAIEPLQLLALEVASRALTDAGYGRRPFPRQRTSVVLGISGSGELAQLYSFRTLLPTFFGEGSSELVSQFEGMLPEWTEDSFPGILTNVTAGRIANRLDLGGTNCTVDAACASSLAAVYWAVKELEARTSDLVIVGGADCMQNPFSFMCFSKTQALSPRGRCQALDESADGIVIGEGIAMLVLKRLADAEQDGDRIYAIIKGVGAASDGRDKSLTAPNREGQVRALKRAYAKAQLSPATVGLIEAHATGTTVGDRIEIESLSRVFKEAGAGELCCAIGSIKTMIGHTKSTAGLASLMKASLALHHKVLPPTNAVEKPNPALRLAGNHFYVNTETRPWLTSPGDMPRRAGVSAFGFGGTNFHVVLEEYTGNYLVYEGEASFQDWPAELLFWKKSSRQELLNAIRQLEDSLLGGVRPALGDLAFTLFQDHERNPEKGEPWRLAVVTSSLDDLTAKLGRAREVLAGPAPLFSEPSGIYFAENPLAPEGKLAFIFPGQGSQYVNMLVDLAVQFPEIRTLFARSDRLLKGKLPRPLSAWVFPPPSFSEAEKLAAHQALAQTQVAQPAMGTADLAMYQLLRNLGMWPDMAAGHSYGEYVALCAAGVLGEADLIALSEARARFIAAGTGAAPGTMAAVNADGELVAANLHGLEGVWIANINAPKQTVISGTEAGVEAAINRLASQGVQARRLPVSCAFHSPVIAPARGPLEEFLATIELGAPRFKVFSNTTAGPYPGDPEAIAPQLGRHLVSRVEFVREIEAMYEAGARIFVEVGPGRVMSGLIGQILGERPHLRVATNLAGTPGLVSLQHALAQLLVHGVAIQRQALFKGRKLHKINLEKPDQDTVSPSTWLVSAAVARPIKESPGAHNKPPLKPCQAAAAKVGLARGAAAPAGEIPPVLAQEARGPETIPGPPPSAPGAPPASCLPGNPGNQANQVMLQYQWLMQRFLETQKNVMLSYLGRTTGVGSRAAAAAGEALGQVGHPLPPAAPALQAPAGPAPAEPLPPGPYQPEVVLEQEPPGAEAPERPATPGTPAPPGFPDRDELTARLLTIVSERTGYPREMLGLNLNLEADLGIDSIKRTEILGYFLQVVFPAEQGGPPEDLDGFNQSKTLREVVDYVAGRPRPPRGDESPERPPAAAPPEPLPEAPQGEPLPRFTLSVVNAPKPAGTIPLSQRVLLVTDDERGIARALTEKLQQRGFKVALIRFQAATAVGPEHGYYLPDCSGDAVADLLEIIRQRQGPCGGLIHLFPMKNWTPYEDLNLAGWRQRLELEVRSLFQFLKAAGKELNVAATEGGAWVLAASGLGGRFASDPALRPRDFFPGHGGVVGLLKTVAIEWPQVQVKAVDLNPEEPPESLADCLLAEMAAADGLVEVGYDGQERLSLGLVAAPLALGAAQSLQIDAGTVILVTGGARGITAAVTRELARRYRPTLIVAGRAPLPALSEAAATADLSRPLELKSALIAARQSGGDPVNLAEVEAAYNTLLKEREIRANLAAMREAGARVAYHQVDVRDEEQFGSLIDRLYQDYGRLDGVIHGAGIIEDKLLKDKTWESFHRVFGTKTASAFILSRKLRPETLKFLVLFSSVAGRFGNRGQCDYTAANEVINKLAVYMDSRWPGRVIAVNWGPWQLAGMVSAEVQRQFAQRGVGLVPPAAGADSLDLELHMGRKGEVEVLLGDGPWRVGSPLPEPAGEAEQAMPLLQNLTTVRKNDGFLEIEKRLDPHHDLYLRDHRLDAKPVLPAAMAIELMAEAAQQNYPKWQVAGLKNVRVCKGIVLDTSYQDIRILVGMPGPHYQTSATMELEVVIKGAATAEPIFYRGTVVMSRKPFLPEPYRLPPESDFQDFGLSAAEAYRRFTFHGPCFQNIQSIRGISEKGIITTMISSTPQSCLADSPSSQWIIDPVVLDCGLQLGLFWQRTYLDITPLPSNFTEIWIYQPFYAAGTLQCFYEVLREFSHTTVTANIYFCDQEGHLLALIKGFESTGSKALNRLAGSHLREEDLSSHGGVGIDG